MSGPQVPVEKIKAILQALEDGKQAGQRFQEAVEAAFPIYTHVEFPWGRGFMRGLIVGFQWWGTDSRAVLRLDSSGELYSVYVFHLYEEHKYV